MIDFVAAPFTGGAEHAIENLRRALWIADKVRGRGHTPLVPHLQGLAHLITPMAEVDWRREAQDLLKRCDAFLRERTDDGSTGAGEEEELAQRLRLPVYRDADELPVGKAAEAFERWRDLDPYGKQSRETVERGQEQMRRLIHELDENLVAKEGRLAALENKLARFDELEKQVDRLAAWSGCNDRPEHGALGDRLERLEELEADLEGKVRTLETCQRDIERLARSRAQEADRRYQELISKIGRLALATDQGLTLTNESIEKLGDFEPLQDRVAIAETLAKLKTRVEELDDLTDFEQLEDRIAAVEVRSGDLVTAIDAKARAAAHEVREEYSADLAREIRALSDLRQRLQQVEDDLDLSLGRRVEQVEAKLKEAVEAWDPEKAKSFTSTVVEAPGAYPEPAKPEPEQSEEDGELLPF